MRILKMFQSDTVYNTVGEKRLESRVYKLLRFSPTKTDIRLRKKILKKILAEKKAIGTIEWWEKGSIVHKLKVPLEIITVFEA